MAADNKEQKNEAKAPISADLEAELRGEIASLREKLAQAETQIATLQGLLDEQKEARRAAKAAKVADGAKVALAKVPMIGKGRREIKAGTQVAEEELDGLTEGVHFEFGLLDG